MKKYELTDDTITVGGRILHRIKALKSFSDVEEGDLGGYVEKEDNLDHSGEAWVSGNARVRNNNNFERRRYDMDSLEAQLVGKS